MTEQPSGLRKDQPADTAAEEPQPTEPLEPARGSDYEDPVDESSADSFPASDPPSFTDSSATRNPAPER